MKKSAEIDCVDILSCPRVRKPQEVLHPPPPPPPPPPVNHKTQETSKDRMFWMMRDLQSQAVTS